MSNEITNTNDMADRAWDGQSEPDDARTDMVATKEPEGHGIEFHVSMRDYTQKDMEALIVESAALILVGRSSQTKLSKLVEDRAIALITERANEVLSNVADNIIDQPLTPKFGDKKPVTMREFIGLYGREYLTEQVDREGKPASGGWGSHSVSRITWLVERTLARTFATEIERATNAAISEIQRKIKAHHESFLAAEKQRLRAALDKMLPPKSGAP